jgi:2-keto-4-pentenoate hydratase/2-oxohepta-3-ene-1,7-dioic acid hydratase in catechol pathway
VGGPATPGAPWLLGPEDRVPWPAEGSLDYELELACVVGRNGQDVDGADVERHVFGYTLVVGWRMSEGASSDEPRYAGASLGPSIVTRDDFDPEEATLTFSVDGRVRSRGSFAGAPSSFADLLAHLSRVGPLRAGEIVGSGTFPGGRGADVGARLRPGAVVGAGATGIGTFVVALGARGEPVPPVAVPAPARFTAGGRPRLLRAVPDLAS